MAKGSRTKAVVAEVTSPNSGKTPTVTRALIEGLSAPKANLPKYRWINTSIATPELEKLKNVAALALDAGVGIITLDRIKGGYEVGLRPIVSGDSSRTPAKISMSGDYMPALKAGLKAAGYPMRDGAANRAAAILTAKSALVAA